MTTEVHYPRPSRMRSGGHAFPNCVGTTARGDLLRDHRTFVVCAVCAHSHLLDAVCGHRHRESSRAGLRLLCGTQLVRGREGFCVESAPCICSQGAGVRLPSPLPKSLRVGNANAVFSAWGMRRPLVILFPHPCPAAALSLRVVSHFSCGGHVDVRRRVGVYAFIHLPHPVDAWGSTLPNFLSFSARSRGMHAAPRHPIACNWNWQDSGRRLHPTSALQLAPRSTLLDGRRVMLARRGGASFPLLYHPSTCVTVSFLP
ncbi:hypothetical protein B0H16DRAFT_1510773, partial [Mycena metata]